MCKLTIGTYRTLQNVRLIIKDANGKLTPTQYLFVRQPYMHITGPEDLDQEKQLQTLEDPILSVPVEYAAPIPGEQSTWEARVEHADPPLQIVEEMADLLPEGWSVTKTGLKYYPSDKVEVDDDSEVGIQLRDLLEKLEEDNDVTEIYTNVQWKSYEPPQYKIALLDDE
jgi:transcriptional/translational regulatory protein YebC/TACO1